MFLNFEFSANILNKPWRHFSELSPDDITIIANDIAQGMEYLHKLKPVPVIHRDLNRLLFTFLWQELYRNYNFL